MNTSETNKRTMQVVKFVSITTLIIFIVVALIFLSSYLFGRGCVDMVVDFITVGFFVFLLFVNRLAARTMGNKKSKLPMYINESFQESILFFCYGITLFAIIEFIAFKLNLIDNIQNSDTLLSKIILPYLNSAVDIRGELILGAGIAIFLLVPVTLSWIAGYVFGIPIYEKDKNKSDGEETTYLSFLFPKTNILNYPEKIVSVVFMKIFICISSVSFVTLFFGIYYHLSAVNPTNGSWIFLTGAIAKFLRLTAGTFFLTFLCAFFSNVYDDYIIGFRVKMAKKRKKVELELEGSENG